MGNSAPQSCFTWQSCSSNVSSTAHSNAAVKYHTHRETVRFTLEWTIENFTTFRDQMQGMSGAGITMAELGMNDGYTGRWCIHMIPCFKRIDNDIEKNFVSLFLEIADMDTKSTIPVRYNTRVTTGKAHPDVILIDNDPKVTTLTSVVCLCGWDTAISHDVLFGSDKKGALLIDDCITISMDVVVYKPPQSVQIPQTVVVSTGEDYRNFATRQLIWFTSQQQRPSPDLDFILQSNDDREFHTSRWILMAHSPVFAAMLRQGSLEQKTSRCTMTGIDGETTEIMLNYLYGCSMHKINMGNVEKVLIMADKYEMMDLLGACEELLANNVTVDKAVHLLTVASQRGLKKLKAAALDGIPKNMDTVLKNVEPEDRGLLEADPDLMLTIVEHCAEKMCVVDES